MARRRYRGRKSPGRILLTVLLWILLLPVILAVVLAAAVYVYLNLSGFSYDTQEDVDIIAAQSPMSEEARFVSMDPDGQTFTIALNKSDVYWVAQQENLLRPLVFDVQDALSPFDFDLDRYGLFLTEGKVYVTARLLFHNFLFVPVRAEVTPAIRDGQLCCYLADVSVGHSIHISPERLGKGKDKGPVYTLEEKLHPRMERLMDVSAAGDNLLLTFSYDMETDLFQETFAMDEGTQNRLNYLNCDAARIRWQAQATNLAYHYASPDPEAAVRPALDKCVASPAYLLDLKVQELALAPAAMTLAFFADRDEAYVARFAPSLSRQTVAQRRLELDGDYQTRNAALNALVKTFYDAMSSGRIQVDTDMVYLDGVAFTASALMGESWADYRGWLDETTVLPLFADELTQKNTAYPARVAELPNLGDMLISKSAAGSLNPGRRAALGLLLQLPVGSHQFLYLGESGSTYGERVNPLLCRALYESVSVPHWPEENKDVLAFVLAAARGYDRLGDLTHLTVTETDLPLSSVTEARRLLAVIRGYLPLLETLDLTENSSATKAAVRLIRSELPQVTVKSALDD